MNDKIKLIILGLIVVTTALTIIAVILAVALIYHLL